MTKNLITLIAFLSLNVLSASAQLSKPIVIQIPAGKTITLPALNEYAGAVVSCAPLPAFYVNGIPVIRTCTCERYTDKKTFNLFRTTYEGDTMTAKLYIANFWHSYDSQNKADCEAAKQVHPLCQGLN